MLRRAHINDHNDGSDESAVETFVAEVEHGDESIISICRRAALLAEHDQVRQTSERSEGGDGVLE